MSRLILEEKEKEQIGPDTKLSLGISEQDGPHSIVFGVTLHGVRADRVEVKPSGIDVTTKEGAPVFVSFSKYDHSGMF